MAISMKKCNLSRVCEKCGGLGENDMTDTKFDKFVKKTLNGLFLYDPLQLGL